MVCIAVLIVTCLLYLYRNQVSPLRRLVVAETSYFRETDFFTVILSLCFILPCALRGYSVGIDTPVYYSWYRNCLADPFGYLISHEDEWGFHLFFTVLGILRLPFGVALILSSLLSILPVIKLINDESRMPLFSYIIYFGTTIYCWSYSTMRQTMALGLCIIAYFYLKRGKVGAFLLWLFIAFNFHVSAIIFIPVLILYYFRDDVSFLSVIVAGTIVVCLFKDLILGLAYKITGLGYLPSSNVGGQNYFLLLLLTAVIGIAFHRHIDESINNIEYFIVLCLPALYQLISVNPVLFRLTWYYQIFLVVFIPNVLCSVFDQCRWVRNTGILCYVVILVSYAIPFATGDVTGINPYSCWLLENWYI